MGPSPMATIGTWLTVRTLVVLDVLSSRYHDSRHSQDRDRGDVPGWVMITMMTAIVVIALLAVFRTAVVNAVSSAFDSITGD